MKEIKHGKTKKIKVCDIVPLDGNYVEHSPEQIAKIKRSIEELGYRSRLGVGKDRVCYYGNGRLSAFMQINPNMTIEVDDLSDLNKKQCLRLSVLDNSLGSDDIDEKKLHARMQEIYDDLEANITNIQETMNIDVTNIVKKMNRDMASVEKTDEQLGLSPAEAPADSGSEKPNSSPDPRPQRQASTKLAKIILEYTREDFDKVKALSEKASADYGVTSTSDLFLKMLEANT